MITTSDPSISAVPFYGPVPYFVPGRRPGTHYCGRTPPRGKATTTVLLHPARSCTVPTSTTAHYHSTKAPLHSFSSTTGGAARQSKDEKKVPRWPAMHCYFRPCHHRGLRSTSVSLDLISTTKVHYYCTKYCTVCTKYVVNDLSYLYPIRSYRHARRR